MALIVIALLYFGYKALKAWSDDFDCKQDAINKGGSVYSSSTGLRDVKTGKHCYIDPKTGKKTLW